MPIKSRLKSCAALATVFALCQAPVQQAAAQGADSADEGDIIYVTARKRTENLQDVPLTVTAINQQLLDDADVRDTFDLAALTPGFNFQDLGARRQSKVTIRGLSTNSIQTNQQKTSSYIDGTFMNGTVAALPFIAFERVEVLKGPQSAAFGRGTFAGAVNYVTRDPGDEFSAEFSISGGSHNTWEASGVIEGPIIEDKLSAVLVGQFDTKDGNPEWRTEDGTRLGGESTEFAMAKIVATPSEAVRFELAGTYVRFDDQPGASVFIAPERRDGIFAGSNYPLGVIDVRDRRAYDQEYDNFVGTPGVDIVKKRIHGELAVDVFADHEFVLSGAYQQDDTRVQISDASGLPCRAPGRDVSPLTQQAFCSGNTQEYRDWQVDARIVSPADQQFSYLLGASFISFDHIASFFNSETGTLFFPFHNGNFDSWSIYGSMAYDITDRLTLGFEARYNEDSADFFFRTGCFPAFGGSCDGIGDPFTGEYFGDDNPESRTYTGFTPRITLDYAASDDLLLYGVVSKGLQPGLLNTSNNFPEEFRVVQQEKLWNYEAGFKWTFADGRGTFNLAGFRMDWTDQAFRRTLATEVPDGMGGTTTLNVTGFFNEGNSRIYGFEAETNFDVTEALSVRGAVGYTRARYQNFCSGELFLVTLVESRPGEACQDVDGNRLDGVPDWDGAISATYTTPISEDWDGYGRVDYTFQSSKFDSPMNLAETGWTHTVNLRLGVERENHSIEMFVENATDDDTLISVGRATDNRLRDIAPGTGVQNLIVLPRESRTWGVRVTSRFN